MRDDVTIDYSRVLAALTRWGSVRDDVRALVLTGSAATGSEHLLSDRDVQVFTTDVAGLIADETWWSGLGDVLVVERLEDGDDNPTRLVHYRGGKIDLTLLPVEKLRGHTYAGPYEVLLDKDGLAATTSLRKRTQAIPSAATFVQSVELAWAAALMQAKAIVRDEPWSAKVRDQDLKEELLNMVVWDHICRYGPDFDIHFLGGRMRRWMDKDIQEELERCWAGFNPRDTARALVATMGLYRRLAARVASICGLPAVDHARVQAELQTILTHGASRATMS